MLTEIQSKLLQMLKEIDGICQEADIHYTLGGGTAIGAIRHGGFIPWDDDIDLYMTRANWEKFKLAERNGKFPPNRVLESAETDIRYSNTFGRYVTTNTTAIHSHQIISEDAAGHVIDIFVFDPIHIDNYWKFMEDFQLYSDLMNETMGFSSRFDMNVERYDEYYERVKQEGKKTVIYELIRKFTKYNSPGWKHYVMEWGTAPFLFPASIFNSGYIRVPFEDTTVEIVRNYEEYLIWQYGDEWKYIPAHDGREGHDAIFSSKLPYQTVREDYLPFIDVEKLHEAYHKRKSRLLHANPHRRSSQLAALQGEAEKTKQSLLKEIEQRKLKSSDLKEKLENNEYEELSEIFAGYYDKQLSADFIGRKDKHSTLYRYYNPVFIELEDELFEVAVELLMRTERMSKARRLIELYDGYNGELKYKEPYGKSDKIKLLRKEIDNARTITCIYSLLRNQELYDLVDLFIENYPKNTQIKRIKFRILLTNGQTEEARKLLNSLMETMGEKSIAWGELLKYQRDLIRRTEKTTGINSEDLNDYTRIYRITNNGYIKREIEKLLSKYDFEISEDDKEDSESTIVVRKEGNYAKKFSFYELARKAYRLLSKSDDSAKENAWNIACRTRDRIELLEMYEDSIEKLQKLLVEGKWDELAIEMFSHERAVLRNMKLGLGLCVHPELSEIQYALFIHSGKQEWVDKIKALIPEQHKKPIGR